ncbi:hypothetical protein ABZT04_28695 [Streptomyces sp. NPDC005492]|uniref:hypothetical protein n=1 Tax=Streptomyces sp. NPDC005492 TaxID=3156883 RepID=UPI0033BF4B20
MTLPRLSGLRSFRPTPVARRLSPGLRRPLPHRSEPLGCRRIRLTPVTLRLPPTPCGPVRHRTGSLGRRPPAHPAIRQGTP